MHGHRLVFSEPVEDIPELVLDLVHEHTKDAPNDETRVAYADAWLAIDAALTEYEGIVLRGLNSSEYT